MEKVLIVVDYQFDFCHPDGSLYVKGAEKLYDKITQLQKQCVKTIFTRDWHPKEHCSFKENGGVWPTHCVEGTWGAEIPNSMLNIGEWDIYSKGQFIQLEEYGAFEEYDDLEWYFMEWYNKITDSIDDDVQIIICGLYGDYCVLETLQNIVSAPFIRKNQVYLYLDGILSTDGGEKLNQFIKDNNINIYVNSSEIKES